VSGALLINFGWQNWNAGRKLFKKLRTIGTVSFACLYPVVTFDAACQSAKHLHFCSGKKKRVSV